MGRASKQKEEVCGLIPGVLEEVREIKRNLQEEKKIKSVSSRSRESASRRKE